MRRILASAITAAILTMAIGCGGAPEGGAKPNGGNAETGGDAGLAGKIDINGSSTVFPIAEILVEEFKSRNPEVQLALGQDGTGKGMALLIEKAIDISNASRPIKAEEVEGAEKAGVEFVEIPVAFDGLCIVVHPSNTWLKKITIDQLKRIWAPESKVKTWKDVDPAWPATEIALFGPTAEHGTYEYFNEVVNGDGALTRSDYQANNDYNSLINGVAQEEKALAYVGFAYYKANMEAVRAVPVVNPEGAAIAPGEESILDGTYAPLSRPLFMYARKESLDRPEVKAFVMDALGRSNKAISDSGYVPLPDALYETVRTRVEEGVTGTVMDQYKPGMMFEEVLKLEAED
jgi:phosphate transport system substrate-binding protein